MRQIGVAVIGYGICGVNHPRVYMGLDRVKPVKVSDTDPGMRRLAERRFNAKCCAEPEDIFGAGRWR